MKPLPRQPAPALDLQTLDAGRRMRADRRHERFTLISLCRGLH